MSLLDVAVFLDELALLAAFAVAGAGFGDATAVSVALAIVLPLGALAVWAWWLAPRAPRRLTGTFGLSARLSLFTLAAVLLALTGAVPWASVFWGLSVLLLVTAEVVDPGGPSPHRRASSVRAG